MSTDRTLKTDKELWQSLATGPVASTAVSDLDFAAWLEGRLSETKPRHRCCRVLQSGNARRHGLGRDPGMPLPAAPARWPSVPRRWSPSRPASGARAVAGSPVCSMVVLPRVVAAARWLSPSRAS